MVRCVRRLGDVRTSPNLLTHLTME